MIPIVTMDIGAHFNVKPQITDIETEKTYFPKSICRVVKKEGVSNSDAPSLRIIKKNF